MDLQTEVGIWGDRTFPQSTVRSVMAHLVDEIAELSTEIERSMADQSAPPNLDELAGEAADCYLLLLHIAHKYGFDLEAAARIKFARNQTRKWGEPDERGVVRHIE